MHNIEYRTIWLACVCAELCQPGPRTHAMGPSLMAVATSSPTTVTIASTPWHYVRRPLVMA
eukprot:15379291-Alexandrium_andersonii.AAC.1